MNNFFSNLGNKVGNAFTNLGQGGNLFNANPSTIASLSDEDKNVLRDLFKEKSESNNTEYDLD